MLARWCLSTFIFGLALFGVVSQQQIATPNQEIVLQFTDVDLTSTEVQNTIAIVKKQLIAVGGSHIKVSTQDNGLLKIRYYSDADVSSIKKAFSNEDDLALILTEHQANSEIPLEEGAVKYNFDIYEIQTSNDSGWDFDGTIVLQLDTKSDRFLDSNHSFSTGYLETIASHNSFKTTFKVCETIALTISEALHTIPEVRAGPFC
ncbi:hypothetical protein [Tamlana sp. I1]|uniref:hypothetical protein n=1 Tax=Tamlana sp. I1 TaxID=2762061 RepID=UPI00188F4DDE|nr:hypothetical protein [Tamlana sp. I1]